MPETNAYRIRRAATDDIRPALEMKLTAWRQAYAELRDEAFFTYHQQQLDAQVAWWERGLAAGAEFYIAEDTHGNIIGLAGATPVIDEDADAGVQIELGMLYVLAEHYGTGLGQHLFDVVIGQRDALVWVVEGNQRAYSFYQKQGFIPDGTSEELTGSWAGLREQRMVRRRG